MILIDLQLTCYNIYTQYTTKDYAIFIHILILVIHEVGCFPVYTYMYMYIPYLICNAL